jgi:hypothetical protein
MENRTKDDYNSYEEVLFYIGQTRPCTQIGTWWNESWEFPGKVISKDMAKEWKTGDDIGV